MADGGTKVRAAGRPKYVLRRLTFVLLLLTGLGLAVPGVYLAGIGGSLYYVVAGALIVWSAVEVLRGRRAGVVIYTAIFVGTILWSLWEVGLDGWALMPRIFYLAVGGIWLLIAVPRGSVRARLGKRGRALAPIGVVSAIILAGAAVLLARGERTDAAAPVVAAAAVASGLGEWTHYGSSADATRYSTLAEITPTNVGGLTKAWEYRSGLTIPGGTRKGGLQLTPLMVDGLVYGCTAFSSVFALDPVTGRQIWRHEPIRGEYKGGHPACRGVTFFRAPAGTAECPTRILLGTIDNRLIALDARTGQVCRSFGTNGAVSLLDGVGEFPQNWSHPTSPPTIVNGTAVIGAYIVDNQSVNAPPGVIRGYDAVTGRLKWAFDAGRPDRTTPLAPGETYTPSTPNSWTLFSGDDALGLVYVPMGNGSPDFIGSNRSAASEQFSSSLVALDAATGAVRWRFQAVHHDLWDYDLAAQPVLVDFPVGGATVPAVILPTKSAQIFVLDRRTGRPLTKVVERRVPASDIPEERAAPTQPFSVEMPNLAGPDLTEADMWGVTPFDQLYCRIRFRQARYEGVFTPMRLGPTIRYPGELGGIDWGSVSFDEGRGLLIVNSNRMADHDTLITRAEADRAGLKARTTSGSHNVPGAAMEGTNYAARWGPFMSGLGVPCQRPPYGLLTAIDLKTRRAVWTKTLGDARNSGPWGIPSRLPIPLGAPNIGGSTVTRGGLIFIAATQDEMFRAVDVATGKTLWQAQLPAGGHSTPMTYRGRDGRQYVLIAAGGQSLKDRPGDSFVAYRLR